MPPLKIPPPTNTMSTAVKARPTSRAWLLTTVSTVASAGVIVLTVVAQ
ncbi:MAG: hypothetical protein ACK5PP_05935 [Acidimicrobiales bacterium]